MIDKTTTEKLEQRIDDKIKEKLEEQIKRYEEAKDCEHPIESLSCDSCEDNINDCNCFDCSVICCDCGNFVFSTEDKMVSCSDIKENPNIKFKTNRKKNLEWSLFPKAKLQQHLATKQSTIQEVRKKIEVLTGDILCETCGHSKSTHELKLVKGLVCHHHWGSSGCDCKKFVNKNLDKFEQELNKMEKGGEK